MFKTIVHLDNPDFAIKVKLSMPLERIECKDETTQVVEFTTPCFYVHAFYPDANSTFQNTLIRVDMSIPDSVIDKIDEIMGPIHTERRYGVTIVPPVPYMFQQFTFFVHSPPIPSEDTSRQTIMAYSFFFPMCSLAYCTFKSNITDCNAKYEVYPNLNNVIEGLDVYMTKTTFLSSDNTEAIDYGMQACQKAWADPQTPKYEIARMSNASFKEKFKNLFKSDSSEPAKEEKEEPTASKTIPLQINPDEFVNIESLKKFNGSIRPMDDLNSLIGLQSVKEEVERFYAVTAFDKERGISNSLSMHMCFMGNPGTGKTTVARIMTGILYEAGHIKKNQCVEVNASQMCGNYIGQTGIITAKIIEEAKGGVLFIDEAYSLAFGGSSYGQEAVSVLLKAMEDERENITVIFAGYEKDMHKFLDMNSGFRSRINHYFKFQDYSLHDLLDIFAKNLREKDLRPTRDAMSAAVYAIEKASKNPKFSNGRYIRNLVEKFEDNHAVNVALHTTYSQYSEQEKERLLILNHEDIPETFSNIF